MTFLRSSALACAALAGLTFVAAAPSALAAPAKRAAPKPMPRVINPQAKALLMQMTAAYQALQSFSCTIDTKAAGGKSPTGAGDHHILLRFKKPDLASVMTSDASGAVVSQMVSDGKNMFMYQPTGAEKTYAEQAVPPGGKVISMALMMGAPGSFLPMLISAPEFLTGMLSSASTSSGRARHRQWRADANHCSHRRQCKFTWHPHLCYWQGRSSDPFPDSRRHHQQRHIDHD